MSLEFGGWIASIKAGNEEVCTGFSKWTEPQLALVNAVKDPEFGKLLEEKKSLSYNLDINLNFLAITNMPSSYSADRSPILSNEELCDQIQVLRLKNLDLEQENRLLKKTFEPGTKISDIPFNELRVGLEIESTHGDSGRIIGLKIDVGPYDDAFIVSFELDKNRFFKLPIESCGKLLVKGPSSSKVVAE